jgi:asparagine synthase (glutamine-hydrolysing)
MWETEGPSALDRLNGIFALAVLDSVTGELFLARDPLGVKPLVYAEAGGEVWFASELRALLAIPVQEHFSVQARQSARIPR